MASPQERLIGLLEYIEQVEKLKRTAARKVPTEFFRATQAEIQGLPGIEFNEVSGGDDVWLRIPRLKEELPPEPSASLRPWMSLPKSPEKTPELRSEVALKADDGTERYCKLTDFPGLKKTFQRYLDTQWSPWAAQERPRRKTISLYTKLFAVQQTIEAGGSETPLEAVWGMGMALWKHEEPAAEIEYPLLTQGCELSLNTETFAIEIRPREIDTVLELDCYADLGVEGVGRTELFWREYRDKAKSRPTPFEPETTEPILKAAVGYLDPAGEFVTPPAGHEGELPDARDILQVAPAWVIFVRRRSGHLFLQDIDRLKKKLLVIEALPAALAAFVIAGSSELVTHEDFTYRGLSSSATGEGVRELYFPMPYNAEQVSIIEKLERGNGVVVEGPPGTGKTHTIANVICHFLAHGKRVLVTSSGEEALRVLQEKLPEEIRSLSVALLTDEHRGMKQFERSIEDIASRVSSLQPARVTQEIQSHEQRLAELHEKIAALDHSIDELARGQLERIRHLESEVSPEELARKVLDGEAQYGWLTDALDPNEHREPQFSSEDLSALREARRRVGQDLGYLTCDLPAAESLPPAEAILGLHQDLNRARQVDTQVADGVILALVDATAATFQKASSLAELLERGESLAQGIKVSARPWTQKVRSSFLNPSGELPGQLHALCSQILRAETARRARLTTPVDVPEAAELDPEVTEAIGRLCEGRSAFALPFGKKAAREQIGAVTVSGLKPADEAAWRCVQDELAHRIEVRKILAIWNALAPEFALESFQSPDVASFRELTECAEHIELIYQLVNAVDRPARALIEEVFGAGIHQKLTADADGARTQLLQDLTKHLAKGRLGYAMTQVDELTQKLEGKSGEVVDEIRGFLGALGSGELPEGELTSRWRGFLAELRRLAGLRSHLLTIERVTEVISQSGAREWARRLRSEPAAGETDALVPADYLEAWHWRIAKSLLEHLEGHEELRARFERRKSAEAALSRTYRALVAAQAWLAVYKNSPESVRQALQEYLNEIQAIGTGRGIRAIHHRQLARAAMERACRAVPCWIMPQWRVAESIPPDIGAFDLVIIDEASQSDIWALPSLLRGQKVLVVGDHRQVSPAGVGMEEQKIRDLFDRFLAGLPHASQMRPDRSIYDLARVVFAGNSVMLKEHFRCVPAIIEFSKREFYEHEIRPLRIPKRSERLDPPLIDVLVKGGYRRGKVNEPEARAIVAEIDSIIEDPATAGRTIGVVTLLGNEQAKLIDDLVRRRIPAHEIVERRIRIGEPSVFQGRESDIMLVSMVLARGDRGLPKSTLFEQRFNVASSRARDRMILFRSIEETEVNPQSLTARLIAHFRQPFHQDAQKVSALRDLCESDFEREMYDELTERGYRVQPQVKVGQYRIDFVIEGTEDRRLAVECDGDRYHGPAQWADDMTRQRVLERAGWTFWRCFASSFVLRRKEVLKDLLQTLEKMGIEPIGSESVDTSTWSSSRIIEPEEVAEDDEPDATPAGRVA